MSKTIYISPEKRPAPHGVYIYGNTNEHDLCCEVAEIEKKELERHGMTVLIADPNKVIAERSKEANKLKVDLYQTIHTNGGGGTGAEMLVFTDPQAKKANQLVYDELVKLYPSKRGLKNGDAYLENNSTNMISVYPELAFHDNVEDAKFLVSHKSEIAVALAKGILRYFGVEYQSEKEDCEKCEQMKARVLAALEE